jgi:hypothetical protein
MDGCDQQRDSCRGGELEQREKRLSRRRGIPAVAEIELGRDQCFGGQPHHANREQPRTERGGTSDEPDRAPRPFASLCLGHGVDHFEHAAQLCFLENRTHLRIDMRQAKTASASSGRGVSPHQRANTSRVDATDTGEVDNQMSMAFGDAGLNRVLEFFGGAAFDERLMRRQHESPSAMPVRRRRNGRIERCTHVVGSV